MTLCQQACDACFDLVAGFLHGTIAADGRLAVVLHVKSSIFPNDGPKNT
jgi:hypothetical protein